VKAVVVAAKLGDGDRGIVGAVALRRPYWLRRFGYRLVARGRFGARLGARVTPPV
jgi:hypothetical protein